MRLLLLHPEVATRPCEVCEKYCFDKDGRLEKFPKHGPDSKPLERPKGTKPPCETCPKITGLRPEDGPPRAALAVELSEQNRRAYEHYLECRAVNRFPNDALVRRHARIIREVEDEVQRAGQSAMIGLLGLGRK